MFILTKIADLVEIAPEDLNKKAAVAIEDNINAKYANKVIPKIGLCICMYDLLFASEGLIGHGTGLVNVNVEFRLVIFRPHKSEVLTGRISSCTSAGMKIRTPFFNNIFVPAARLEPNTYWSENQSVFIWQTSDSVEDSQYYDLQEVVRFRVDEEIWTDQSPVGPREAAELLGSGQTEFQKPPYEIIASMDDSGLGPCVWWDDDDEEGAQ